MRELFGALLGVGLTLSLLTALGLNPNNQPTAYTAPHTALTEVLAPVAHEAEVHTAWWDGANSATRDFCSELGGVPQDLDGYAWCDIDVK